MCIHQEENSFPFPLHLRDNSVNVNDVLAHSGTSMYFQKVRTVNFHGS